MKLKSLIEQWETFRRRDYSAEILLKEMPPNNGDRLIKNGNSGLVISDNNFAGLWSGKSKLLMDGESNKTYLAAEYRVAVEADIVSIFSNTITINNFKLNEELITSSSNTLLKPNKLFNPDLQIVLGNPIIQEGQYSMSLGDLMEPTSLVMEFIEVDEEDWSSKILKKMKENG